MQKSGYHSRKFGGYKQTFFTNCGYGQKPFGNYICIISGVFKNKNGVTVKNYAAGFANSAEKAKKRAIDRILPKARKNYKIEVEKKF